MKKSKKVLALILALTMLIGLMPTSSITVFAEDNTSDQSKKLGYGFNALKSEGIDFDNLSSGFGNNRILDGIACQTTNAGSLSRNNYFYSESREDFTKTYTKSRKLSLNASVPIKAATFDFDTEFGEDFSNTYKNSKSHLLELFYSETITQKAEIVDLNGLRGARTHLTQNFTDRLNEIRDESDTDAKKILIGKLFNDYGTHAVVSVYLGGTLHITNYKHSSTETSAETLKDNSSLSASIGIGKKFSLKSEYSENSSDESEISEVNNDEIRKITGHGAPYGGSNKLSDEEYKNWQNNLINTSNIINFVDTNSLIPVWDLTDDPNLRQDILNYYTTQQIANQSLELDSYIYKSPIANECSVVSFSDRNEVAPGSTVYFSLPYDNVKISLSGNSGSFAVIDDPTYGSVRFKSGALNEQSVTVDLTIEGMWISSVTFTIRNEGYIGANKYFSGGYGTEERPYLIRTYSDLQNIDLCSADAYCALINDINVGNDSTFTDNEFVAISKFDGVLDGRGYAIYNYKQTTSSDRMFLGFIITNNGIIKNLRIGRADYHNSSFHSGYSVDISASNTVQRAYTPEYHVGILVALNNGTIENCTATNCYAQNILNDLDDARQTIAGVGGIVATNLGNMSYCTVEACYLKNRVNRVDNSEEINVGTTGGIAAYNNQSGFISDSVFKSSVIVTDVYEDGYYEDRLFDYYGFGYAGAFVGGIVGRNKNSAKVYNCFSESNRITANTYHKDGCCIGDCYNYCGGVIGANVDSNSEVVNCAGISNNIAVYCIYNDKSNINIIAKSYTSNHESNTAGNKKYHDLSAAGLVGKRAAGTVTNCYTDHSNCGNSVSTSANVCNGQSLQDSAFYRNTVATANTKWRQNSETGKLYFAKDSQETIETSAFPVVKNVTPNSIQTLDLPILEYKIDGGNWDGKVNFTGLSPNSTHYVYVRYKETNASEAGAQSNAILVKTPKQSVSAPAAPTKLDVTSNSVTLNTVSGCEYSKDGITWQDSPAFNSNIFPNTEYTFYQRYAETETAYASEASTGLKVKTDKSTPESPSAPTVASYTDTSVTLKAVSGCEYSKNGTSWQDSNAFTGLSPNTTYTFYQRIKAGDTSYASALSTGTNITTLKASVVGAVQKPVILAFTDTTITLQLFSGYEYSIDGGENWQIDPVFVNLSPFTEYAFCQRVKETNSSFASDSSDSVVAKTDKSTPDAPDAPTAKNVTATSIELYAVTNCEYSLDGIHWQDNTVFNGLSAATEYSCYQRIKEGEKSYPSEASEALTVRTAKSENADSPSAPSLLRKTATTVTLRSVSDAEYKCGSGAWQTSNIFTNLTPNTEYRFYVRYAETETALASAASPALYVTTDKESAPTPGAPTAKTVTAVSVTLNAIENGEYSMDGVTWQNAPTFTGLSPATTYSFYQRTGETEEYAASDASTSIMLRTDKSMSEAPDAPIVQTYSSDSVTLNPVNGCEYSIDGTNWQSGTYFGELEANTAYTFYQRVAETISAYASASSNGTTIKTDKATVAAPAAPTVDAKTENSVTVTPVEGCEYRINDSAWQISNVFTGLTSGTEYVIYQRFAETNSTKASEASVGVAVVTDRVISATDPQMVIGTKTARAGETVTLFFELKNAPELKSIALSNITYDNTALELIKGEWKITDSILQNWNSANQTAAIAFADNCDVNGEIFALTFKVKDGTADGNYSVNCSITAKSKLASGAEKNIAIPTISGNVNVVSVIRGDVNGDNIVTSDDAIQVLYYTLLPDIYTVNQDADFNGDGLTTSDDAIYLLYYTLLPDLYPLH